MIPVSPWVWVLCVVALWGAYGHWKYDRLERQRVEANAEAARISAKYVARKIDEARRVHDEYAEKLRRAAASTRILRNDNARLQQKLARNSEDTRDTVTVCGVDGERAREIELLLAEGAGVAAEGAEEVVRLAVKIDGLQSYISRVCVGNKDGPDQD